MLGDIWNSKVLKPPLVKTYKSKAHDIDFANVQSLLSAAIQTHIIHNTLLVESCIMRKVIYRLKLQFRHDKGFKFFEATNRFLNHLFNFNISKDLRYFLNFVPLKYEKVVSLPCKQMLEYLLVRLQGYAQVCARIVETSFKCINFMKARLLLGHQWEIALVVISIASRIWFICRHYAIKCCLLYNNLLPLLEKLQITGEKWLPDLYEFPTDLTTWLNYDWLIEIPDIIIQLPVGIPNFVLDDDDVQFIGQYNHTYIIPDDSDDDNDTSDVKFVCNLNNKKLKLNKKQVRNLQSRFVITLDDSGSSDDQFVPSSKYDDIFELLDDDIQIIESPKYVDDDIVEIDDKIDENANIEQDFNESNDSAIIEKQITKDTVEDQDDVDDTGEPIDEEIEIISVSEEESEINVLEGDKDIGEPITRQENEEETEEEEVEYNEEEEREDEQEYEEKQEENEEIAVEYNEEEQREEEQKYGEKQEESEEEEVEYNEEEQSVEEQEDEENEKEEADVEYNEEKQREDDEDNSSIQLEETQQRIEIYEYLHRLDTIEKIKCLLKNEDLKRKTDKHSQCLFVNIPDNVWYHIAFHIKYFIAMTVANSTNKTKYLIKSKNVLLSIALEKQISTFIPTLKNKMKYVDNSAPMTLKGKEYLIHSIDSLSDLQLFIAKEIHKREKSVHKSLFSNFNFNEWTQIYNKFKYLIVMGMKRPIRSNMYLKKAKAKLSQLLLNKDGDDSDSTSGSDEELITQINNFDNMYKSREDSCIELFNYIQDIEDYVCPPNMKNILRERIERNFENLNVHIDDGDGNTPNKKRKRKNNSSSQSCNKNFNVLIEQPRKLTRSKIERNLENLNAHIYDENGSSPNKKRKRKNNSSSQSCKKNRDVLIEQPRKLTRSQIEKNLENLNTHIYDENGSSPNKKRKRKNNSSSQSCNKNFNVLIEQPRKLTRSQIERNLENLNAHVYDENGSSPNKNRKLTNNSSSRSCNKNFSVLIEQPRKLTRSQIGRNIENLNSHVYERIERIERNLENLSAHIYDGDDSLPNKKRKGSNNSSPHSCKKNRNVLKEQPQRLTRSQKERKVKKKGKLN